MHKDYGNPFFDDIMSHCDNPDLTWKQHNFNIFSLMFVLAGDLSWFNFEFLSPNHHPQTPIGVGQKGSKIVIS